MEIFYAAFTNVFLFNSADKFKNQLGFIKSFIPVASYSYEYNVLHNYHCPDAFRNPEILKFQWDDSNKEDKHWTSRMTPLTGHIMTILMNKHKDLLLKAWDSATFDNGNNFNSQCFDTKRVSNGIKTIW